MKIAVNTRWLLKDKLEGMGWFTHSLLLRLTQEHPEVEFHFLFDRKPSPDFKYGSNVVFHRVPPPARHPLLWRIWNHLAVPFLLKRIKPDLYFSPDGMAAMGYEGKQLLAVHDLNYEHHPEWLPVKVGQYFQKYMVQYARMANRIVCVSQTTLNDANRTWGIPSSKMDVVYNAPQGDFKPMRNSERQLPFNGNYFVCVGALNPRKNLSTAVRAFSKYRLSGGQSHLVFVGSAMHDDPELNRVLEETPYDDYIHFIGRRSGNELNVILSQSQALLFPSLFEGFGIPIVEAMAAGTPVLSSNVSCMPEIGGDASIQLPVDDIDLWTEKMHEMDVEENRQFWIEKGLTRAAYFNWDDSARKLWKNIEHTIEYG